jgi:hypothetical protein
MTQEIVVPTLVVATRRKARRRRKMAVEVDARQHSLLRQVVKAAELSSLRNSRLGVDTTDYSNNRTLIIPTHVT